jgi:hypothetical protein
MIAPPATPPPAAHASAPADAPGSQPSCAPGLPDAGKPVIVCGQRTRESPYRLPKIPSTYGPKPIRAETDVIPGVHTDAHVESAARPDSYVAKRLMVTFKMPF